MESANTKKRFSPFRARRAGSRPHLSLTRTSDETALMVLDFMQRYDVLPSTYIKVQSFSTPAYIAKVLTTLQEGHYIGIPASHPMDIYRVRWLEVWKRGYGYLGDRYLGRKLVNDPHPHKSLRSLIEYHRDRLPGVVTPLEVPTIQLRYKILNPDNAWRIEYRDIATATMYFFEEDDTGSERLTAHEEFEARNKTIRTMLKEYEEYFADGHYRGRYPTISVLIHTTKAGRAENILDLIAAEVDPQWQPRFAVKAIPDFLTDPALLPEPRAGLLATDYARIRNGERERFNIPEILKATELKNRR